MIGIGSRIQVIDNSAVKYIKCIYIYNKRRHGVVRVGDRISGIVRKVRANNRWRIHQGDLLRGIIVRIGKKMFRRQYGLVWCGTSAVVSLHQKTYEKPNELLGTRVLGPIFSEVT